MKCFRFFFVLVLLLQNHFSNATTYEGSHLCNLPAPSWINAVEITSSKIKINWATVSGAHHYKVSRYDVTHGVQLADAYPVEAEYTSEPHDPGTTIEFQISAVDGSGGVGDATTADYTTTIIIVDDIASFSTPNPTQGNYPVAGGAEAILGFTNADKNTATVNVQHHKVRYTEGGTTYFAEFLLWTHCSSGEASGARIKYWNESTWSAIGVSKTENHLGGPDGPVISIDFKVGNAPFFTLKNATYLGGAEGAPNTGTITLRNTRVPKYPDQSTGIYFEKSTKTEVNPCYVPHFDGPGDTNAPEEAVSDDEEVGTDDRSGIQWTENNPILFVSPNPFSENFQVHYTLQQESPVTLTLYDHTGRQLKAMELPTLAAGDYNTGIYTNDLPAGIYLLAFQTNQSRQVTTLVKHH